MMNTAWAATSTASGRFDALETCSDIADLNDRFEELRARGAGYLELRPSERSACATRTAAEPARSRIRAPIPRPPQRTSRTPWTVSLRPLGLSSTRLTR